METDHPREVIEAALAHVVHDIARNLLLYAWFECSFMRPAELQASACLEMGLRYHLKGLDYVLKVDHPYESSSHVRCRRAASMTSVFVPIRG